MIVAGCIVMMRETRHVAGIVMMCENLRAVGTASRIRERMVVTGVRECSSIRGHAIVVMVAGRFGRAVSARRKCFARVAQQLCREPIRANLKTERPVRRRHESRGNERTNDQCDQQRADHPQALFGGWNPAHSDETFREGLAVYRFGSRTSTVTCDSVGTSLSFCLK